MNRKILPCVLCVSSLLSSSVLAAVGADEAKQLGGKLTPWGAEKAGNKEGTIPAYADEKIPLPAAFNPKTPSVRPDPYASENSPTLEAAFAWLYANIPEQGVPVLVHGDASLRNLLVHEGRESAMLDWELWHVGDHNEDLAYCRGDVEQFIEWDEFMAEYLRNGGHAFDADAARYYEIFGAVRNAVFAAACLHSFVHAPVPEPKLAYGALAMGRKLICAIAQQIGAVQA